MNHPTIKERIENWLKARCFLISQKRVSESDLFDTIYRASIILKDLLTDYKVEKK